MNINPWHPEWYGLTAEHIDNPESLDNEYKRYQYLRFLVYRIEANWGHGADWEYSKNIQIIQDAKAHWDDDDNWVWPSWITKDMEALMSFLLGHVDILNQHGPAARAL